MLYRSWLLAAAAHARSKASTVELPCLMLGFNYVLDPSQAGTALAIAVGLQD